MKFKKILLLGYSGQEMEPEYWKQINKITREKVFLASDDPKLKGELKNIDCLLVKLGAKVPKQIVDKFPNLKYIGMYGTGVGGIDLEYARKKKITVCNIADYATEGVAEFTFGILLDFLREIERAKVQARGENYSEASFAGSEIKNKNFGIIGLGHIGFRVAELANAFKANVCYWSKNRKLIAEKNNIKYHEIDDLLKVSDIITLNLSLNPETNDFLNKSRVNMIKKGAILINTSPMELVDLEAITKRLKKGNLSFILDHSDEMDPKDIAKLKPFKNCIIYPPIGYVTKEATALKKNIFINNLKNFLKGKPGNKVN